VYSSTMIGQGIYHCAAQLLFIFRNRQQALTWSKSAALGQLPRLAVQCSGVRPLLSRRLAAGIACSLSPSPRWWQLASSRSITSGGAPAYANA